MLNSITEFCHCSPSLNSITMPCLTLQSMKVQKSVWLKLSSLVLLSQMVPPDECL